MYQNCKHRNGRELSILVTSKALLRRSCDSWISESFTKQSMQEDNIIPRWDISSQKASGIRKEFVPSYICMCVLLCGKTILKTQLRGQSDFQGKNKLPAGKGAPSHSHTHPPTIAFPIWIFHNSFQLVWCPQYVLELQFFREVCDSSIQRIHVPDRRQGAQVLSDNGQLPTFALCLFS